MGTAKKTGETQLELNFVWGFAQGSFEDSFDRPMPGIVLVLGGQAPSLPLVLSTEIGWLSSGFDDYVELQFPSEPISAVNIETNSSILMAHLVTRIAPPVGKITPYLDGLIGIKYLSSHLGIETQVILDDNDPLFGNDSDRIRTSNNFDSFTVSYGVGTGINMQIFEGPLVCKIQPV